MFSYVVAALEIPGRGVLSPAVALNSLLPLLWPIPVTDPIEPFDETVLVRLGAKEFDEME